MAAGATLDALQQGRAGIAVVFSTDPSLSEPGHRGAARTTAACSAPSRCSRWRRRGSSNAYGNAAAAPGMRDDRQAPLDGRAAAHERRGGERHAAARRRGRVRAPRPARRHARACARGPRIAVGAQDFIESRLVALVYAQGLRGGGFNASVADVGGFRDRAYDAPLPQPRAAARRLRLVRARPRRRLPRASPATTPAGCARCSRGWMRRYRITVFPSTGAGSRNRFVMLRATASALGLQPPQRPRAAWATVACRRPAGRPRWPPRRPATSGCSCCAPALAGRTSARSRSGWRRSATS